MAAGRMDLRVCCLVYFVHSCVCFALSVVHVRALSAGIRAIRKYSRFDYVGAHGIGFSESGMDSTAWTAKRNTHAYHCSITSLDALVFCSQKALSVCLRHSSS